MALTSSGALKAQIESLGLGISAYRDEPPAGTLRPYVTITEEIALVPDSLEDGTMTTGVETAQVDLWQNWHDPTSGAVVENYNLAPALKRGLHGVRLGGLIGTKVIYMAAVRTSLRLPEPAANVVHHSLTVEIWREL